MATLRSALPLGVLAIPLSGNAPTPQRRRTAAVQIQRILPAQYTNHMGKLGYIDTFRFSLPTSVNNNKQDFFLLLSAPQHCGDAWYLQNSD